MTTHYGTFTSDGVTIACGEGGTPWAATFSADPRRVTCAHCLASATFQLRSYDHCPECGTNLNPSPNRVIRTTAIATAVLRGITDGFTQPREVRISHNVEDLAQMVGDDNIFEWLDRGINIGQLLRSGRKSEAWRNGWWPFTRKGATP